MQLLDFETIRAAVVAGMADPTNTELRAEVLQALRLRFVQDPVFRAAFIAAIFAAA